MDLNVGDMPIEIFGDYISDNLGTDYPWEYITTLFNGLKYNWHYGDGFTNYFSCMKQDCDYGDGYSYNLGEISLNGNGRQRLSMNGEY